MVKDYILCVDDEKIVIDSLRNELRSRFEDYKIEIAQSGEEALEIVTELKNSKSRIPVVVSDYIMPEMKGDELLINIHKDLPETYKIMLTGQASTEGVVNAINSANLYRFVSKPWDSNDLLLTINEALKSFYKDLELEQRRIELEIANKRLTHLDKSKTYFLGLLSHELYTPLIGIQGFANVIKTLSDDVDIRESCDLILESEKRLKKFSDIALLITRISTEKYELQFESDTLLNLINTSLYNLEGIIRDKSITVMMQNIPDELFINADISLISKVFDFVLDNAIKFSPVKSNISINGEDVGEHFSVTVSDSGSGFGHDTLTKLFELFVSDDLMTHSDGHGLSLAAFKVIMDAHNFEISAKNSETSGAVVTLKFLKGQSPEF